MAIPADYEDRVYAGVLGKIIGVYLGRPFEGWRYERIMDRLGEVHYYVHEQLGKPLIVTDDDISGTFTFIRALSDCDNSPDVTAEQIGECWLNYIIEERTVLWWGGMGRSTEHTAYMRLKAGVKPPEDTNKPTSRSWRMMPRSAATSSRVALVLARCLTCTLRCGVVVPSGSGYAMISVPPSGPLGATNGVL